MYIPINKDISSTKTPKSIELPFFEIDNNNMITMKAVSIKKSLFTNLINWPLKKEIQLIIDKLKHHKDQFIIQKEAKWILSPDAQKHYHLMRLYAKMLIPFGAERSEVSAELMLVLWVEKYIFFSLKNIRACVEEYLEPIVLVKPDIEETTPWRNKMVEEHNKMLKNILESRITYPYGDWRNTFINPSQYGLYQKESFIEEQKDPNINMLKQRMWERREVIEYFYRNPMNWNSTYSNEQMEVLKKWEKSEFFLRLFSNMKTFTFSLNEAIQWFPTKTFPIYIGEDRQEVFKKWRIL
jgi:hypothetical protein